ncbi:deoxycytidylate deaminase [Sediminitomix flava]|uniref:dCMP deaminase n=1 Tax=Sediminitomix flava TaxID=379075 RepID=A0A315ZE21_SEDFL|nr:dCMP deaminase family protein [Sediminitomix flava]PWJ43403.1 dCMP deaminase [Sediminitomix flava]
MNRDQQFSVAYMKCAISIAELSRCERAKVGAIIVKDGNIISMGYNGTPKGFDNSCELEVEDEHGQLVLQTKSEVLHAEANAITKAAKSTYSTDGADLFCTHSCCFQCSKLIVQAGIKRFFYSNQYRDTSGLELLRKAGIEVIQVEIED